MKSKHLSPWTKLPSGWIETGGLKSFQWSSGGGGGDNIAALMTLTVIASQIDAETGVADLTYDNLADMTTLSRSKVSAGLKLLTKKNIVVKAPEGRGTYGLFGYNPNAGWAQFPSKGLYHNGMISAFSEFRLRRRSELDALKLYFLFAARRSRDSNMAQISFEKITDYSGVAANYIKPALSVLTANTLIHVERLKSTASDLGYSHGYRLAQLNTHQHMGTIGRADDTY